MATMGVRKQQAAQTESELKAAAVRLFERNGYLNTKITDITAEAGRATGSFYKHFTSKEALLEALLADLLDQGDATVLAAGAAHLDDFGDIEAVRWHVRTFVRTYRQHHVVLRALQQAAIVDSSFARRRQELLAPDLQHFANHLGDLSDRHDPLTVASMITGLMWAFVDSSSDPALLSGDPAAQESVIEQLSLFIHAGLEGLREQN